MYTWVPERGTQTEFNSMDVLFVCPCSKCLVSRKKSSSVTNPSRTPSCYTSVVVVVLQSNSTGVTPVSKKRCFGCYGSLQNFQKHFREACHSMVKRSDDAYCGRLVCPFSSCGSFWDCKLESDFPEAFLLLFKHMIREHIYNICLMRPKQTKTITATNSSCKILNDVECAPHAWLTNQDIITLSKESDPERDYDSLLMTINSKMLHACANCNLLFHSHSYLLKHNMVCNANRGQ